MKETSIFCLYKCVRNENCSPNRWCCKSWDLEVCKTWLGPNQSSSSLKKFFLALHTLTFEHSIAWAPSYWLLLSGQLDMQKQFPVALMTSRVHACKPFFFFLLTRQLSLEFPYHHYSSRNRHSLWAATAILYPTLSNSQLVTRWGRETAARFSLSNQDLKS